MVRFKFKLAILLVTLIAECGHAQKSPNVVFFLVDDLGWADVGCFGSRFHQTPNIDKLCESGMKFTRAYAASPVCSPTRASILTGRHPVRVDITDWIPGVRWSEKQGAIFKHVDDRDDLALSEVTIAEVFKANGYSTFFAGKWHLGGPGSFPVDQGFDFNIGGNRLGSPPGGYYSPWTNPTLKSKADGEYLTERLTEESVSFIKENRSKVDSSPFFLYLSYYNVHTPITVYEKRIEQYRKEKAKRFAGETPSKTERDAKTRLRQDNAAYGSMVTAVDDSVGTILRALEESGYEDETIICFFSDNGGLSTLSNRVGPTCNLPLRGGKGWLYEGGIREPMVIRAPGTTVPQTVCEQQVVSMDFFPTLLDLAGIEKNDSLHLDGRSLLPLLRQDRHHKFKQRTLYWHYPHYHGSGWTPGAAVMDGDWKLIEFYHHGDIELFNLKDDQGEENDLAQSMPEKTQELRRKLKLWQESLGAKMPMEFN